MKTLFIKFLLALILFPLFIKFCSFLANRFKMKDSPEIKRNAFDKPTLKSELKIGSKEFKGFFIFLLIFLLLIILLATIIILFR